MKLYTEEQVIELLEHHGVLPKIWIKHYLNELKPIELPSDEEIEKFANKYVKNKWEYAQDENKESFIECAKWMRDKIQGGNK